MGSSDDSDKTEEPTDKKLSDAREKGQVPTSKDVSSFFVLLGGAAVVLMMAPGIGEGVVRASLPFIENPHKMSVDLDGTRQIFVAILRTLALYVGLPILVLMVFAVLGHVIQNGFVVATERIKPELSKLNPLKGLKNLVSLKSLVEFFKSLLKLLLIGAIMLLIIVPELDDVSTYSELPLSGIMDKLYDLVMILLLVVLTLVAIIAAADFAYQKYEFNKQMRMSQQEIKEEFKNTEGSPEVKARIRQIRMERAQSRMMQAVPSADVVVTNPTHYAVALKYDGLNTPAPVCVAKGQDHVALRIREVALENDVTIVENPPVARALFATVDVDEQIHADHYQAVAQIISYVYKLKRKKF